MKEEGVPPRDDMPVQGIFDPETGQNITGEAYSESKADMEKELKAIRDRAIGQLVDGSEIGMVMDSASQKITGALEQHFFSMKQPVDEDMLAELKGKFGALLVAYSMLLEEITQISSRMENGYTVSPTTRPKTSFYFGWESDLAPFFLDIEGPNGHYATLLAIPHCRMHTASYSPYFFGGEPPAADIIWSGKHGHIFICQEGTPPPEFYDVIFLDKIEHLDMVPMMVVYQYGTLAEISYTDPACVDVAAEPSESEIQEIIFGELQDIMAIGIVVSGYPEKKILPRHDIEQFP